MRFIIVLTIVSAALYCQGEVKVKSLKPRYTSQMTVAGYAGESTLENFPVPVRISEDAIEGFDYSKCDGQGDITFTDANGIVLPHEIEVWNTEGESVAWVSVPALTQGATFNMNWAHQKKLETVQSQEVWTAANYLGVYHMNTPIDTAATTKYQMNSVGGVNLTMVGTSPSIIDGGVVGKRLKNVYGKSSAGDILHLLNAIDNGLNKEGFTLSGWAYWYGYSANAAQYIMEFRNPRSATYPWEYTVRYNNPGIKFGTASPTRFTDCYVNNGWFNWSIVVTGKRQFDYYINGVLKGTKTVDNDYYVDDATHIYYRVGGTQGFNDEIRVLNVSASSDWVKAEYDSVNNTQFITASAATRNSYGISIIVR